MRDTSRDNPIEAEIQALIASGDFDGACTKAWEAYKEKVVASYRERLRGYVDDLEADGEDVAQEVFGAFWSSLPRNYNPSDGSVRAYLLGIAQKCVVNKIRTQNRVLRTYHAVSWEMKRGSVIVSQSNNPERVLLKIAVEKERKERLARAVERLPAPKREILKLYYDHNLSATDIAELKGTTPGAIRTQLCRIHISIREGLYNNNITISSWIIHNHSRQHCGRLELALIHESVCQSFSSKFYRRIARHLGEFIKIFFT